MSIPSTANVYNGPLHSVRSNPVPGATELPRCSPPFSNIFGAILVEYDSLCCEVVAMRHQRDELRTRFESQVAELNLLRQSLLEIRNATASIRQQHEEELSRLRVDLMAVSQGSELPSRICATYETSLSQPSSSFPSVSNSSNSPMLHEDRLKSNLANDSWGERRDVESDQDGLSSFGRPRSPRVQRDYSDMAYSLSMRTPYHSSAMQPSASKWNSDKSLERADSDARSSVLVSLSPAINLAPQIVPIAIENMPANLRKEAEWRIVHHSNARNRRPDVRLKYTFNHPTIVCCVRFSADGKLLATGCIYTTQIYDVQTGEKICVLEDTTVTQREKLHIRTIRFSYDGKLLATGSEDHKIRIWNIAENCIHQVLNGHKKDIYSIDFSHDGRFIVSGSGDKMMEIWGLYDHSYRAIMISNLGSLDSDCGITSVAISPDGSIVAAGSLDNHVRIWDITSGKLLACLGGHEDSVYSIAFTPDSKGIISGSLDKTIKYWDLSATATMGNEGFVTSPSNQKGNGQPTDPIVPSMSFVGHKDFVLSVSVSHDGQWVASGSKDCCIHFWDSHSATLQFVIEGHKNSVTSIDINPLGGMLATGSGDKTARIWTYTNLD